MRYFVLITLLVADFRLILEKELAQNVNEALDLLEKAIEQLTEAKEALLKD